MRIGARGGLRFSKKRRKHDLKQFKEILEWMFEIILVIAIAYLLVTYFGSRTSVPGYSMEPTLSAGDNILVNQFIYIVSDPKQGDVVIFQPNGNQKSHYYVRRVAAVPGDTVRIEDGKLYVNGAVFDYPGAETEIADAGLAEEEITLKDGEYFVIGDDPAASEDSRYANIGNVKREYIIGKVWFRFSSIRDFGLVQ